MKLCRTIDEDDNEYFQVLSDGDIVLGHIKSNQFDWFCFYQSVTKLTDYESQWVADKLRLLNKAPAEVDVLGGKYTQYWYDCEGNPPNMPPGTRIVFLPDHDAAKEGAVLYQRLHHDGYETFFGNVILKMDDGRCVEANCWQCEKVDKPCGTNEKG